MASLSRANATEWVRLLEQYDAWHDVPQLREVLRLIPRSEDRCRGGTLSVEQCMATMKATRFGPVLGELQKHGDADVRTQAQEIVAAWRVLGSKQESRTAAAPVPQPQSSTAAVAPAEEDEAGDEEAQEVFCEKCGLADDGGGNALLLCDACDDAWHMGCLPALSALSADFVVSSEEWFCPECTTDSSDPASKKQWAYDLLDQKIEVYWDKMNTWYEGKVLFVKRLEGKLHHQIQYDSDGEICTHDLSKGNKTGNHWRWPPKAKSKASDAGPAVRSGGTEEQAPAGKRSRQVTAKRLWSDKEEQMLREVVAEYGPKNWAAVAERLDTGRSADGVQQHWQAMQRKRRRDGSRMGKDDEDEDAPAKVQRVTVHADDSSDDEERPLSARPAVAAAAAAVEIQIEPHLQGRLEAAERALGEVERRATAASSSSASRESERLVDELVAKHAPRGLRLHWEQLQLTSRGASMEWTAPAPPRASKPLTAAATAAAAAAAVARPAPPVAAPPVAAPPASAPGPPHHILEQLAGVVPPPPNRQISAPLPSSSAPAEDGAAPPPLQRTVSLPSPMPSSSGAGAPQRSHVQRPWHEWAALTLTQLLSHDDVNLSGQAAAIIDASGAETVEDLESLSQDAEEMSKVFAKAALKPVHNIRLKKLLVELSRSQNAAEVESGTTTTMPAADVAAPVAPAPMLAPRQQQQQQQQQQQFPQPEPKPQPKPQQPPAPPQQLPPPRQRQPQQPKQPQPPPQRKPQQPQPQLEQPRSERVINVDDDDDDAVPKPPPMKRARSAESGERRERSSRPAAKQGDRFGRRSKEPREVRAWGPLRRGTKVLVPTREFGVAGDEFYEAFVQKVYAPGMYEGKYYPDGFTDLFFTADGEWGFYDVKIASGWYDADDEDTSDDEDDAASAADDDEEEDGEEEVQEVEEVQEMNGRATDVPSLKSHLRGDAAGRARPKAAGRGDSRAGGSATHKPARAGSSSGGGSSSSGRRVGGGGGEAETRVRRLTETLSMGAQDAEARANAERIARELESKISGLGAGANKQARVLLANLAKNRDLCRNLRDGSVTAAQVALAEPALLAPEEEQEFRERRRRAVLAMKVKAARAEGDYAWIDRTKVQWRGDDDEKKDTPPSRGSDPLRRASSLPVRPTWEGPLVGFLPSKSTLVELERRRSSPSGVELTQPMCAGLNTKIGTAMDAGDNGALRDILDTLAVSDATGKLQNLAQSKLAKTVKKLETHQNPAIAAVASKLVKSWKALVADNTSPSGVELTLPTCLDLKTKIGAAMDAGDEGTLRDILDTLLVSNPDVSDTTGWENLKLNIMESKLAQEIKKLESHDNAEVAASASKVMKAVKSGFKAHKDLKKAAAEGPE